MMTCKIGEKIRQLRLTNKMTQEQLADRLGISYRSVIRWENGVTYPDIEFLPAIAKHFSVSLDYLLGQDDIEKQRQIRKQIRGIADMTEDNTDALINLIRTCRREQRIDIGMRQVCVYAYLGEKENAYAVLDDVIKLMEKIMDMPDGTELCCTSPALNVLKATVHSEDCSGSLGTGKSLAYRLENGQYEVFAEIFPGNEIECLAEAEYARWGWLNELRKEERFVNLIKHLENKIQ